MDSKEIITSQNSRCRQTKGEKKHIFLITLSDKESTFFLNLIHELAAFMSIELIRNSRNLLLASEGFSFFNITREIDLPSCVWCQLCLVSDVFYLTSLGSVLFGFNQLAPGLADVVAGLIHAVLNAVHHFTLPYHNVGQRTELEIRMDMKGRRISRWNQVRSSRGTTSGMDAPRMTFMYT